MWIISTVSNSVSVVCTNVSRLLLRVHGCFQYGVAVKTTLQTALCLAYKPEWCQYDSASTTSGIRATALEETPANQHSLHHLLISFRQNFAARVLNKSQLLVLIFAADIPYTSSSVIASLKLDLPNEPVYRIPFEPYFLTST